MEMSKLHGMESTVDFLLADLAMKMKFNDKCYTDVVGVHLY